MPAYNEEHREKLEKIGILGVNISLLVIHGTLLFVFLFFHVFWMVLLNTSSFLIYSVLFLILFKKKYLLYAICAFLEIWIFMILSTLYMGWDYGFQYYCIALVPVTIYTIYSLLKKSNINILLLLSFSILVYVSFIVLRIVALMFPPFYTKPDGISSTFCWMFNAAITFAFLMLFMYGFVGAIMKYETLLQFQAERDQLTGLFNRRKFDELIKKESQKLKSEDERCFIAILDIDDFKKINDTFGHLAGDFVLVEVAKRIAAIVGADGAVSRWGGEEFGIILNKDTDSNRAERILKKVQWEVSNTEYGYENERIIVSITLGAASLSTTTDGIRALRMADENLYYGKLHGKNQCVF